MVPPERVTVPLLATLVAAIVRVANDERPPVCAKVPRPLTPTMPPRC